MRLYGVNSPGKCLWMLLPGHPLIAKATTPFGCPGEKMNKRLLLRAFQPQNIN